MKNLRNRAIAFIMALFIAFMGILPLNAVSVSAATSNPQNLGELFDAQFYASKYPEVVSIVGNDEKALFNHFVQYGLNEGKTCSPYLNVSQYRENYPDVAQAHDHHWDDIVKHYFNYGIKEGRQSFVSQEDVAIQNTIQAGTTGTTQTNNSVILDLIDNVISDASNSAMGYVQDSVSGIIASANGCAIIPISTIQQNGRIKNFDELAKRCGNDLILIRDSYNRIKFVGGRFSNVKVKDETSALQAIDTMATLYNFDTNRNYLMLSSTGTDSLGNPFYRFVSAERKDDAVNSNYTVTLSVDSYGNVLGASNSNSSSLDAVVEITDAPKTWGNGMSEFYADPANGYTKLYDDAKLLYDDETKRYYWAYYYESAGLVYEVLVGERDGKDLVEYTRYYDAETFKNDPSQSFTGDYNFKNITIIEKPFVDFYGNTVKLPAAYDTERGWYIVDPKRSMLCVESSKDDKVIDITACAKHYFSDEYFDAVNKYIDGNNEINKLLENEKVIISAFTTLQMSYDENKALGMLSKPKTIYVNYKYDDDEDNASQCTYGGIIEFNINNNRGNADFAGIAHEFGHAVVANQGQTIPYQAATGAINESYADIIGSLLKMIKKKQEQYSGNVDFDRWLLGEFIGNKTEHVIRNLSDPSLNKNGPAPFAVNDDDFIQDTGVYVDGEEGNDLGGVHQNSSILSHICYRMYNEVFADRDSRGFGVPNVEKYKNLLKVWYDSVIYLNHDSTYGDVKGYVLQSMKNHGYSMDLVKKTEQIFNDANVDGYKPFDKTQSYDRGDLAAAAKVGTDVGGEELSNLIEGKLAADDAELDYEIAYGERVLAELEGKTGDELEQYENNLEIARNTLSLSEKNVDELQNAFEDSQERIKKMVDDKMAIVSDQEKVLKKVAAEKETNPNLEGAYRALRRGLKKNINDVDKIIDAVEDVAVEFKELDEISDVFSDVWEINFDDFDDSDIADYFDEQSGYLSFDYGDYPEDLDAWDYYDYWDDFWDDYWEEDDYWYGNDQDWDEYYNYYDEDYSDEDYFSDWYDDWYYDDDWYYGDDDYDGDDDSDYDYIDAYDDDDDAVG